MCINLWGVAVIELDSHPDHKLRTLRLSKDPCHISLILSILHRRQPTLWLQDLCLEVLTVHGNELHLFGAKAFPLLVLLMVWTGNQGWALSIKAECWTHNLPVSSGCATCYAMDAGCRYFSKVYDYEYLKVQFSNWSESLERYIFSTPNSDRKFLSFRLWKKIVDHF